MRHATGMHAHYEELMAFRRLLWRRLARLALALLLLAVFADLRPRALVFVAFALLAAVATWAAMLEQRAKAGGTRHADGEQQGSPPPD